MSVELLEIPEPPDLDSIRVYWHNIAPGKGYVTITCYGCAWNSWFGGMGGMTIQEFFKSAGVDYLVARLGSTQWIKASKQHDKYFTRIVKAVKAALENRDASDI